MPSGLVVRIPGFHCHGPGSILGWGTEIPQATWHGHTYTWSGQDKATLKQYMQYQSTDQDKKKKWNSVLVDI